jgi:hypothetical protein
MRKLILALCLLAISNCWAGIGTVTDNKGDACSIERNKQKMTGVKGSSVESNDTYVTGNCVSNITFKDETKVKVTENSRLLIDDFVFDPKASDAGKLALKVGMGTVRYASGQIAKNSPQKVDIKTPTAAIAVRGTDFTMTVDEAGQSLVVLLPSCKDEKDIKKYELEENTCKVGKIEVSTAVGTVSLDKAFEATFVTSMAIMPTPPAVLNIVEGKIGNNLIIVKPNEIQHAIKEQGKTKQDKEQEELEAEAQRRLTQMVKDSAPAEKTQVLPTTYADGKPGCNPRTSVCVAWERNDTSDIQSRGKGVVYRITDGEHYAEVKTAGYSSNTFVRITHDDNYASTIIGDGSPGGNIVNIKQNTGVLKMVVK